MPNTQSTKRAEIVVNPKRNAFLEKAFSLLPGVLLTFVLAAFSILLGERIGGPVMLYALILGGLINTLSPSSYIDEGVSFSANHILRFGIALMGVKITLIDIADLGLETAAMVIIVVTLSVTIGTFIGKAFGFKSDRAVLSAGSVSICGASAALAIAATLPQNEETERNTVLTIILVTALSTIAMVLYPLFVNFIGLSETKAGVFIGVTIHNVAQTVGAGYMVSENTGEVATIVKLMRVACLVPAIIVIGLIFRSRKSLTSKTEERPPLLPAFMIAFITLVLMSSFNFIPVQLSSAISTASYWALVMSLAGLGIKTSFKDVISFGSKPLIVMTLQTVFLAVIALAGISFF